MTRVIEISVILGEDEHQVGQLAWDCVHGKMAFRYHDRWLAEGFSLGADLPLTPGVHYPIDDTRHPDPVLRSRNGVFGFVADHSPGEHFLTLLKKAHLKGIKSVFFDSISETDEIWAAANTLNNRFSALKLPLTPSFQSQIDLGGETQETTVLSRKDLLDLASLLETCACSKDIASKKDFSKLLLHTAPFGGIEPKLLITPENPKPQEWVCRSIDSAASFNTALWRTITAKLAQRCGLDVVDSALLTPRLYAEERFDTDEENTRYYCASAATLVNRKTSPFSLLKPMAMSYLDIADILNREGVEAEQDLKELYGRLLFNTLTANHHDRLDQIWFGRRPSGWSLLPMHCPCLQPAFAKPRLLSTPIRRMQISADSETAISVSKYFGIKPAQAKTMRLEFMHTLAEWKQVAEEVGADYFEISQLKEAFECN